MVRKILFTALTLILMSCTLGAYLWNRHVQDEEQMRIATVRASIERLEREVRVQAGTGKVELNGRGWPNLIDPAWFKTNPPMNVLVPIDRPWLEVASAEDEALDHPGIRQSVVRSLASFWYNPATGRVRARVGPMVSDEKALVLYNAVNGAAVATLFDRDFNRPGEDDINANPRYERLLSDTTDRPGPMIVVRRQAPPVRSQNDDVRKKNHSAPPRPKAVSNVDDDDTSP